MPGTFPPPDWTPPELEVISKLVACVMKGDPTIILCLSDKNRLTIDPSVAITGNVKHEVRVSCVKCGRHAYIRSDRSRAGARPAPVSDQ